MVTKSHNFILVQIKKTHLKIVSVNCTFIFWVNFDEYLTKQRFLFS